MYQTSPSAWRGAMSRARRRHISRTFLIFSLLFPERSRRSHDIPAAYSDAPDGMFCFALSLGLTRHRSPNLFLIFDDNGDKVHGLLRRGGPNCRMFECRR